jgi:hypothetical protein
MPLTPEQFDDAVVYGSDVTTRCEVVDATGQYVIKNLDVTSGSVSDDVTRKTRRQCTLTLQDPTGELVPNDAHALLQPYSEYYLRLYRGVKVRGETEELPLGTFAPYAPKITDSGDSLEISVTGYDKSKIISRLRWITPYTIPSGTNTALAIKNLLLSRMPSLKFNIQPTNSTVPLTVLGLEADNDPWADADKIASADGMEIFFDEHDVVVIRDIPDPDNDPIVASYDDGDRCTVTEFSRENDGEQMYTGVIVYSEGSEVAAPIRVEVWRPDTTLRIPYFFPTALITTIGQATTTAESLFRRVGKGEYSVEITAIPDPRRRAGDVIHIQRELSQLNDAFVAGVVTMPLDATSPMTISTTQRRMA